MSYIVTIKNQARDDRFYGTRAVDSIHLTAEAANAKAAYIANFFDAAVAIEKVGK